MSKPRLPAFDPADIAESNATGYPDIDNHARAGADGRYVHARKDGTPH